MPGLTKPNAPGTNRESKDFDRPETSKPGLKLVVEPGDKQNPATGPGAMYNLDHFVFNVPFKAKGEGMVGREEQLLKVRDQLEAGKRTAIVHAAAFQGIGGLGKTLLAVEYAHRYKDRYPKGVIWIDANREIDPQLMAIAQQAHWISPESKPSDILETTLNRLIHWSQCLVIFDNVERYDHIEKYLPAVDAAPHLLVTGRLMLPNFHPVEISELDHRQSLELLMKESHRDFEALPVQEKEAAKSVVNRLEGLPLAIEIAGAYLAHSSSCTFHRYKTLLEAYLMETTSSLERNLFATLKVSEPVLKETPLLKEIIDFLTWSGSAFMDISLLAAVLDKTGTELIAPLDIGAALKILQKSEDGNRYDLHRLAREVLQGLYPIDERSQWVDRVCLLLGTWFEDRRVEFKYLPIFEAEFDHLKKWSGHAQSLFPVHAARLTWLQAYPAYHWGKYDESFRVVQSAFSILDKANEADTDLKLKLKADILNDLGSTSSFSEKYTEAIKYHRDALEIRLKLFGELHLDTAMSYNNIGSVYDHLAKHTDALQYFEKTLEIYRRVLGEEHPDTAISYHNIGYSYGEIGKHREALQNKEKALEIYRNVMGEQHPDTADAYNNIGSTLGDMGKHQEAIQYYRKAIDIYRNARGEEDPDTTNSVIGLIRCLIKLKRFPEASEQLDEWLHRLSPDHEHYKGMEDLRNTMNKEKRNSLSRLPSKKKKKK